MFRGVCRCLLLFIVFSQGRVVRYTVFTVFVPPPNPGENSGQKPRQYDVFLMVFYIFTTEHLPKYIQNTPQPPPKYPPKPEKNYGQATAFRVVLVSSLLFFVFSWLTDLFALSGFFGRSFREVFLRCLTCFSASLRSIVRTNFRRKILLTQTSY